MDEHVPIPGFPPGSRRFFVTGCNTSPHYPLPDAQACRVSPGPSISDGLAGQLAKTSAPSGL